MYNSQGQDQARADAGAHRRPPRLNVCFSSSRLLAWGVNRAFISPLICQLFELIAIYRAERIEYLGTGIEANLKMHHGSAKVGCGSAVGSGFVREGPRMASLFHLPAVSAGCTYWMNGYHVDLGFEKLFSFSSSVFEAVDVCRPTFQQVRALFVVTTAESPQQPIQGLIAFAI